MLKNIFLCIFFFLCLFSLFFSSNCIRVPLTGDGWIITDNSSYFVQGQLPGTIHTILLAAKQITEPYLNYNDINLRSLIHSSWTFTKNFTLTNDVLLLQQFTLHFEQIDTVATITLNQCFIGYTDNMFVEYTFDVIKSCLHENNQLKIDFQSPVVYANNRARSYNDSVPPECTPDVQHGECHVQFIRKEPCSFSWDWGPAFAPIGITGDFYLEGTNLNDLFIKLESINVASFDINMKKWQIDILLSSENDPFLCRFKFILENTSFTYETNQTIDGNLSVSIFIPDNTIQLWWPNGYGEQILYRLTVYNENQLIGSRLIGFRTIELIEHDYGPNINGSSFYFLVNYQKIFIKGSNWIPPDAFKERVTNQRLERLLYSAKLANINMLRIWGGGIYERDEFYEMADRLGIMLWHDFMFACSLYPVNEMFLDNVFNEILYQVKRLQSHASIVLWSGNNENEAAIAQNWFNIPQEKMDKVKNDYRKLYVDTIMKAVKQIDKGNNRPFITSSPSNGIETVKENYIADDPNDPRYGDVHFYGYGDDSWNPNTYPITRFLSETGIQSLPSLNTWYEVTTNTSDLNLFSDFVQHREHSEGQINGILKRIKSNLPLPMTNDSLKNFTQFIYLSQINQAMTLKSISDHCRYYSAENMIDSKTSFGNTMGLMYWQINDIWQAPTWATIEYNLKWKMAHYYVKHMYEPVYPLVILTPYLAKLTDKSARISFYIHNDLLNDVTGQLMCSIHKLDVFSSRISFSFDVTLNLASIEHVSNISYPTLMKRANCLNENDCILKCLLNYDDKQVEQIVFLTQPKHYQLYESNLTIEKLERISSNDINITISAIRPALFVWLDVPANVSGYFSYNGFHMFEPIRKIYFHSWTSITDSDMKNFVVSITSLFDLQQ